MTPEYTKSIKLLPRPGLSDYVNIPASQIPMMTTVVDFRVLLTTLPRTVPRAALVASASVLPDSFSLR